MAPVRIRRAHRTDAARTVRRFRESTRVGCRVPAADPRSAVAPRPSPRTGRPSIRALTTRRRKPITNARSAGDWRRCLSWQALHRYLASTAQVCRTGPATPPSTIAMKPAGQRALAVDLVHRRRDQVEHRWSAMCARHLAILDVHAAKGSDAACFPRRSRMSAAGESDPRRRKGSEFSCR